MNKEPMSAESITEVSKTQTSESEYFDGKIKSNISRSVITDYYVPKNISSDSNSFKFNLFVRLNAKEITFKNISFIHCIFDGCYITHCVFDSCDFTGARFIGSNFHQTAFKGCKFDYTTFERSQLDDDILISEAPKEENLKLKFARSLRMNFQQIGDAKAVNKAISLELDATSNYLYKSWRSGETYYKEKYPGFVNSSTQFIKWVEFWILDFVWGNGESILKLIRTIIITIVLIATYETNMNSNILNIGFYWESLRSATAAFLGVPTENHFTINMISLITSIRLITIALLTALLVKRFSRR